MTRLVIWLAISLGLALGAAWLIALPGTVAIDIGRYRLEPGLGTAIFAVIVVIFVSILVWALLRRVIEAPARLARHTEARKKQAGVDALSDGYIALEAGEFSRARHLAREAQARLADSTAAQLLEARADLALGDFAAAREHYRALIANPKTAIAALAGLYEQAKTQDRSRAALTFARKALTLAPTLDWASQAVFEDLAARGAWSEALKMTASLPARTRGQKSAKRHRQGVLETALAISLESTEPNAALEHANAALKSIPDFPPAALVAARIHINRDETRKAMSLLKRVWTATGHPDAATLYAHVKPGASALERLKRLQGLIGDPGTSPAAAIVLARTAIDAYEWSLARNALAPLVANAPTRMMCLLMAEIEEGQLGDQGKARTWVSRALSAPADPTWVADGVTSDEWAPASPVTGRLDAFEWKIPVTAASPILIEADDSARPPDMLELPQEKEKRPYHQPAN
ncbi:heme biosynthesis protein HemY [Pelagibacterium limicola]|uniref:heme biosynthesis protein HemY n=1 Tax=Pelagibacterium limicola TaxID=2791022 RepID=UPI0018AFEFAB|nr:heme biosynthesis HemY N-terminal domain-containing protein [Pelagibacterium limicola]